MKFIRNVLLGFVALAVTSAWQSMMPRCMIVTRRTAIRDEGNNFIDAMRKSINTERERVLASSDLPTSKDISELPASFDDAVDRAANRVISALRYGTAKLRIDFDTSIGDQTYTTLKNTLPMTRFLVQKLSNLLELSPLQADQESGSGVELRTLRIFFPDMGAAALARRDWKMGTNLTEVPPCVRTANIQNDPLEPTDKLAILLCPLWYETDYVQRVVGLCEERSIPCMMINPQLISGDQGFGARARAMRSSLINPFITCYKLKTLVDGAVVREWPSGFSVWMDDANAPEGYTHLQSYVSDPPNETVLDLIDANKPVDPNAKKENGSVKGIVSIAKGVNSFFQGLSKL